MRSVWYSWGMGIPAVSPPLRNRPAWAALQVRADQLQRRHLRDLFAESSDRGTTFTAEAAGIYLDYSKNRIDVETSSRG